MSTQPTTSGKEKFKESCDGDLDGNSKQTLISTHNSGGSNKEIGEGSADMVNDAYVLPTNDEEWSRLNKQHEAINQALGALYPAPDVVQSVLAPQEGKTKSILDLGCGNGAWAIAMAKEFPHAQVTGVDERLINFKVDLLPTQVDKEAVPSNCKFEIDDANLGLLQYQDKFDVIYARFIASGLANFRKAKENIEKCLKPGGLMIWFEFDYHLMARNMRDFARFPSDRNPNGSWTARLLFEMAQAVIHSGRCDIQVMRKVLDRGLWSDPLLDPRTCHCASLYLPTAPWVEDVDAGQLQRLTYIGTLMRHDCSKGIKGADALLKKVGYKDETIKQYFANMDDELDNLKQPTLIRMILAWGRRKGPGQDDAPPLRPRPQPADKRNERGPYPFMVVYDTPEKALVDANLRDGRRESIQLPPLPPGLR